MKISQYLAGIKRVIITCRPEDTLETAATLLTTNQIGAMPVRDANGDLVGMFSERDIIRALSQRGHQIHQMRVGDIMSRSIISCGPEDTMQEARQRMKRHRLRHVPVVENGKLVGLISISDTLEATLQETDMEVHVLRDHAIARRGMS
jgi:CBS domain-containing protein